MEDNLGFQAEVVGVGQLGAFVAGDGYSFYFYKRINENIIGHDSR
jgi:hypothetical protein